MRVIRVVQVKTPGGFDRLTLAEHEVGEVGRQREEWHFYASARVDARIARAGGVRIH